MQFSKEYQKLEERLWEKHGIELVFVDGPLLDVNVGKTVGQEGGGINAIERSSCGGSNDGNDDDDERVSRRWYVEENTRRRAALPTTTQESQPSNTPSTSIQYSGLDASLLHLSQIWSRGGANISNNLGECLPFQGVMGVGQGADVAGLLPLLNYQNEEDEDDYVDCEKENKNDMTRTNKNKPSMFQGLQFVIAIDGKDILHKRDTEEDEEELDNDVYVGPDGVQSLHVINTDNSSDDMKRQSSERLAKQYGPNATIHHYKQSSTPPSTNTKSSCTNNITPSLSNIIGKFLVSQKNKLHSNTKSRELLSLQTQLANVEQLATLAISQEIQRNPPKALMAVIGPTAMMPNNEKENATADTATTAEEKEEGTKQHTTSQKGGGEECVKVVDKAVGAWHGARRRGFGEEGGGAPCPEEFLLREEER